MNKLAIFILFITLQGYIHTSFFSDSKNTIAITFVAVSAVGFGYSLKEEVRLEEELTDLSRTCMRSRTYIQSKEFKETAREKLEKEISSNKNMIKLCFSTSICSLVYLVSRK